MRANTHVFPLTYLTCFEAGTGNPGGGEGNFLNTLNSLALPVLQSSGVLPQYDIVIGQRMGPIACGALGGTCSLQPDDGLITTEGNQLCGPGGCAVDGPYLEEINPGLPDGFGLCHSGALLTTTCLAVDVNTPMAAVQDTSHPLWDKFCTFLGVFTHDPCDNNPGRPRGGNRYIESCGTREEVDISNPPSQGCPTSGLPPVTPVVTTCSQNCTAQYTSGTAVTLTAAVAASGYTFTGWGGACAGLGTGPNGTQCTLTMQSVDANLGGYQVTANFGVVAPAYCFYTITSTITGISGLYLQVFGGVACEPTYPLYVELSNGCAEEGVCTMTILTFATLAEAYEYCANIYGPEICLEHVYE